MANKDSNGSGNNNNKRRNPGSRGSLLNNLAFWAVIFLAAVMMINALLCLINKYTDANISTRATGILQKIAFAIAIGITLVSSYYAARGKGKNMFILWLVCAILVALSYILGIVLI